MVHWRKFNELTLEAVGARLGVTHATVSRWEHGEIEPGAGSLERLAALYKTDIHSMLNRLPAVPARPNGAGTENDLAQLVERISGPQRAKAAAILKALLE